MRKTLLLMLMAIGGTAWAQNSTESEATQSEHAAVTSSKHFVTLQFAFDSSRLGPADRQQLEAAKAWIDDHPDHYLLLEGHTDPIGTDAYNAGLATRRGETVRSALLDMGVDPARLVVAVYGENVLTSSDNAANRRVVVRSTDETLDEIIARTFRQGMAVVWSYEPSPRVIAQRDLGRSRG